MMTETAQHPGSVHDESSVSERSESSEDSRDELQEVRKLVNKDSSQVGFWRLVVVCIVVGLGISVTWMTYSFLIQEESRSFQSKYEQHAVTILESSSFAARSIKESYDAFGDHIMTYAMATNASWPFYTVPELHRHGKNLRRQTKSLALLITRVIEENNRHSWDNYTTANRWSGQVIDFLFSIAEDGQTPVPAAGNGPWAPIWEMDPAPILPLYNLDISFAVDTGMLKQHRQSVFGQTVASLDLLSVFPDETNITKYEGEPFSTYLVPLFDSFDKTASKVVGVLNGYLRWGFFFSDLLLDETSGIFVVLDSGVCSGQFTWLVEGREAIFLGEGDRHDEALEENKLSTVFGAEGFSSNEVPVDAACVYRINVYPSQAFRNSFSSRRPVYVTSAVASVFGFVVLAFIAFDFFQTRRNNKILDTAAKTSAVMNAMFPLQFRDRILSEEPHAGISSAKKARSTPYYASHNQRIKRFLEDTDDSIHDIKSKPLADFYPEATVMFADIVGFTAWCSVREPSQVFTLLETLYAAFDAIAKKRRVFKVETVGDCYVAACGVPEQRKEHALIMARFAYDCLQRSCELMKRLEVQLGPDTGELTIRIGLHSGPVTAGILRGERPRFQLFGDTMNFASRMESTGMPGLIHISEETASLLRSFHKDRWIQIRADKVNVKGKGILQTYWLAMMKSSSGSQQGRESSTSGSDMAINETGTVEQMVEGKRERLVDWHVDIFSNLLKQIVARRSASDVSKRRRQMNTEPSVVNSPTTSGAEPVRAMPFVVDGRTCFDEVKDIIVLPQFDKEVVKYEKDLDSVVIDANVITQLRDYIRTISHMYNNKNAFHNFEHASHVTMSVSKLLSRIVMPTDLIYEGDNKKEVKKMRREIASTLHDHTYGITSDPLTQFTVVFSALIHDVDHAGVPNQQLIKENSKLASVYRNKSVAEQNSIVLAWNLLMDSSFADLRATIYSTEDEQSRFRQLVVQTVLATDIIDQELKTQRNARWEVAFHAPNSGEDPVIIVNRKATIVIEHLIQASDVAHTMQHWHIYRKWNEKFFHECYQAFLDGRSGDDPSANWYEGEIAFFDHYIVPLAKKLKDCGVFGVASDEYLNYAVRNREEWQERGREVVAEMIHTFQQCQ